MVQVKRWRAVLVVAAAALVMSACGGGNDDDTSSGGDASGDPVAGGSASIIQMSEPRILDPAAMTNGYPTNAVVGNALFGTLMVDNPDGKLEFVLAKSFDSSDGGKTWTLTLRDGLTYSDGSPMTAADVAFNWERIKDPALGSQSRVVAEYVADMKPEGQVLTFTLTEPIANFQYAILFNSLNWVAKPDALKGDPAAFDKKPIGAGPFTLESWTRGGKMVLAKNTKYFDKAKPYLDELVLSANGDEGQRVSTVEAGGADATLHSSSAFYKRALESGLKGTKPDFSGGIIMNMNSRFAPFDDPKAREAVAKAMDLKAVNAAAYEGVGVAPETYFPKESPFYNGVPLTAYDKAGAQKLFDELAAAGKPVEFKITAYQTSESKRVAEAFQTQLNTYKNVKVDLEVLDFPAAQAKVNAREFQMAPGGMGSLDPETTMYQQLHSDSSGNFSGISDPKMDAALEAGRLSSDIEERKAAYKIVAEQLAIDNPSIIYTKYTSGITYDKKLGGVVQYGNGSTRVDTIWTSKK